MTQTTTNPAPPSSRRTSRSLLLGVGALVAVIMLTALAFAGLRAARPGALPGTTVNGTNVGGLQGEALRDAVIAAGSGDLTVLVVRGDKRWEAGAGDLGYTHDVDATLERVLARGRQGNPVTAFADHLRAFRSTTDVAAVEAVDGVVLNEQAQTAADRLSMTPVEGTITISGTSVGRVQPAPGAVVDAEALADAIRAVLLDDAPVVIEAPTAASDPLTTAAAVEAVATEAEQAVSAGIELTRADARITLSPEEIGGMLRVEQRDADLVLDVDPQALRRVVPTTTIAALASEPTDARISLVSGSVQISDSTDGFTFDADIAAEQVLALATGAGPRSAELDGEVIEPSLSTADAEALNIVEQVSTFTTEHACCQGRVTNIQRMADTVDGALIKPGETFSLNDFVGERTPAKGYVGGGAIQDGLFVEEVGGGVSQFTTTMFNAAFFGGYAIPQHKTHSYYISRYPVGREATLNFPTVDLKIRNNSPHGILVSTSHTPTSITVSFWGTTWVEVSEVTGERRNITSPQSRTVENPDLAPGTSRVTSSGRGGFDITVVRILRFPDGREEREEFFTRYLAEPIITERNSSASGPAQPAPSSPPASSPSPSPSPEPAPAPAPSPTASPSPSPAPAPSQPPAADPPPPDDS